MMSPFKVLLAFTFGSLPLAFASTEGKPIVDLGYVVQQASNVNHTGGYVNFTNIAFAEPPLGDLRFAAPKPPQRIRGVQDGGSVRRVCPQGVPQWLAEELPPSPPTPQSEDCLYLDVMTPIEIFENRNTTKAPVLVWIYGGGFVLGDKTGGNDPAGLVKRSIDNTNSTGAVYVALNYRLGAFGFLGGNDFRSAGGTPNAGLYDQRLALEWVQQYIHEFGGDASEITVMGESAGATSTAYQILANVSSKAPFQQAIFQSPAQIGISSNNQLDDQFDYFLKALGVSSLGEARKLNSSVLQQTNSDIVTNSSYGTFTYGPTIDDIFVRGSAASQFLAQGFDASINFIASHNSNEGAIFTPSNVPSFFSSFEALVKSRAPSASPKEISYIVNTLYPPPRQTNLYSTEYDRALLFDSEFVVLCNVYGYQKASANRGYAYEFSVPPGYHVQDVSYTFFNGPSPAVANSTVAIDMQNYFTNFAVSGSPNAAQGLPAMPVYGAEHQLLNLTISGYPLATDNAVNPRCEWLASPKRVGL